MKMNGVDFGGTGSRGALGRHIRRSVGTGSRAAHGLTGSRAAAGRVVGAPGAGQVGVEAGSGTGATGGDLGLLAKL